MVEYRIHPANDILNNDDALDVWMRQTVGTAGMFPEPARWARIPTRWRWSISTAGSKALPGLWVADASVMPRIPRSGGAHATVIMIGERVVDWIAAG